MVEKYGYDKSWEWYTDTALHRAVRKENVKALRLFLEAGADPVLTTGYEDDVYPTVFELAEKPDWRMRELPKGVLEDMKKLLNVAKPFWNYVKKETYQERRAREEAGLPEPKGRSGGGAHAGTRGKSWIKCENLEGLKAAIKEVSETIDWSPKKEQKLVPYKKPQPAKKSASSSSRNPLAGMTNFEQMMMMGLAGRLSRCMMEDGLDIYDEYDEMYGYDEDDEYFFIDDDDDDDYDLSSEDEETQPDNKKKKNKKANVGLNNQVYCSGS